MSSKERDDVSRSRPSHGPSPDGVAEKTRIRRYHFKDFPVSFWSDVSAESSGIEIAPVLLDEKQSSKVDTTEPTSDGEEETSSKISKQAVCSTCVMKFDTFAEQRGHFKSDHHKYNLKRRLRNKPVIDEQAFESSLDCLSEESLSGSDEENSDDEDGGTGASGPSTMLGSKLSENSVKLEFPNSGKDGGYIVVYKAALPDLESLSSLSQLGSWGVIITGGGHFSAGIWGKAGNLLCSKSFHRYTTRKKQGGSQAVADASRGGGSRIKSAGATLRRYGEEALQKEVHTLLRSWQNELSQVQCVYIRASTREKRDLLVGWNGSPLKTLSEKGLCRPIPFTTRRATVKEITRAYEELATVILSPVSLRVEPIEIIKEKKAVAPSKLKTTRTAPVAKGTDHLKKRAPQESKISKKVEEEISASQEAEPEPPVELDPAILDLIKSISRNDESMVIAKLNACPELKSLELGKEYFKESDKLNYLEGTIGLTGIAAVSESMEVLQWLLLNGVSPAAGSTSPYLITKSKKVRTFLRTFWAEHPELHDYAAAKIPSPLSKEDISANAEKEKERRRRERERKKEKALMATLDAKPPEVRARELRAAAAEARLFGNRCAVCKKSLQGITPFERLTYKYCSTKCLHEHRQTLANM